MKNIRKHKKMLTFLCEATPKQRRAMLNTATPSQIKCICEICYNILKGNLRMNIDKLKKYKSPIRKLADRNISIKQKKRILVNQSGGFIGTIIPAIISAISAIASAIK